MSGFYSLKRPCEFKSRPIDPSAIDIELSSLSNEKLDLPELSDLPMKPLEIEIEPETLIEPDTELETVG